MTQSSSVRWDTKIEVNIQKKKKKINKDFIAICVQKKVLWYTYCVGQLLGAVVGATYINIWFYLGCKIIIII